jgi:choline dehydrogenase-like flavoprotein
MHIDARKLESNSVITGDICIIGAGAAGISMAMEWNNTGTKVILLEGGGFEYDDKVQDLYAGKSSGQRYYPLRSARLHQFGGTTGHWAGFCSVLDPIDFEKREWVDNSGWPIRKEDLDPAYARAHQYLQLGPYDYNLEYWQRTDDKLKPALESKTVWNKIWQFSPPTRFGKVYKEPILNSRNIHLYTYANVVDITGNEAVRAIESVTIKNLEGKTHTVKAKVFILACCSIQNARLLLASNKQKSKGIGNDNDQVGRYFMEHLEMKSAELWLTQPQAVELYMFNFGMTKVRAELAITAEAQRINRILNGTASLIPLDIARNRKPIIDVWTNEDPRVSADSLVHSFRRSYARDNAIKDRAYELFTRIEQSPNPNSRVTLDNDTDALGVPRPHLHWELTALEKRSIRKIYELIGQAAGETGVGRIRMMDYLHQADDTTWPSLTGGGWHHMGTTRMTDDPKTGVVDRNCKVYGVNNLYVAGASCFTTAGAVNPTLTLVALTLRLSDHLKEKYA